jgi:hypothetical protein
MVHEPILEELADFRQGLPAGTAPVFTVAEDVFRELFMLPDMGIELFGGKSCYLHQFFFIPEVYFRVLDQPVQDSIGHLWALSSGNGLVEVIEDFYQMLMLVIKVARAYAEIAVPYDLIHFIACLPAFAAPPPSPPQGNPFVVLVPGAC